MTGEAIPTLRPVPGVDLQQYANQLIERFSNPDDALAPQLQAAARQQRRRPAAFVEDNRAVFGELADDPRFTGVYSSILSSLLDRGVRKTFADLDHYATPREESP